MKKPFSIFEIYGIALKAFRSMGDMVRGRKSGVLTEKLQERVMLGVTAVNDCPMCSYAHTEMALEAGLSEKEIRSFVEGDFPDIPQEEVRAVLFAQHYADSRGRPSGEAWEELCSAYGREKAGAILAASRAIMLGNAMGIVFSSVRGRWKEKKPDPRCSVLYETAVIIFLPLLLLFSLLSAGLLNLLHVPRLRFPKKKPEK